MRWLRAAITYVRALIATWKYPEKMSVEQRQSTAILIMRLAQLDRLDTCVSDRHEFSPGTLDKVPRMRGVYRIYEGHELKYIGASCRGIQWRLRQHYHASRDRDKAPNKGLADLIASGRASVEWYVCPFAGWMEDFELTEYCREHGQPPCLNRQRRGGLVPRCLW
jgi:hypothetical protein